MEERKPLLPDASLWINVPMDKASINKDGAVCYTKGFHEYPIMSAPAVRHFYEDLITRGELLTKEEHERLVKQAILDHESNQRGSW